MKKIFFAVLTACMFLLASCEKVVNIDLNESDPQYVIEGSLNNYDSDDGELWVTISKTTDFYGRKPAEMINNATVTLTKPDGTIADVPLYTANGNGIYSIPFFEVVTGGTYSLKVQVDGKEFTATTTLPARVPFDSITTEYEDGGFGFLDPGYGVTGYITDPEGVANNYRLITRVNDTAQDGLALFDDKYNDGKPVDLDQFDRFQIGDTISMELRTMDRPVFEFYTTLRDALNNGQGPAPANPNTNIKGGALGYFGAFGVSKIGVRIRE